MRWLWLAWSLPLVACAEDEAATVCSGVSLERAVLVLEVDLAYEASALGRIDRDGCLEEVADISLGDDPVLADAHGRPHVLNRTSGEIHEIDRERLAIVRTVAAMAPGDPSPNPWDVDLDAAGRLWVAGYDTGAIGLVAPDGSWEGEIDLSAHADADGTSPEASVIEVDGETAYVLLERLNRDELYQVTDATEPGRVVAFAVAPPHEPLGSFELGARNPVSATAAGEGSLVVASPGDNYSLSPRDGVEIVELAGRVSRVVLDEEAAGGSVLRAVIAGPGEAYAIIEGPSDANPTSVVAFDPDAGQVTSVLAQADSFEHSGLIVVGGHLLVGQRTKGAARVLFFERATKKLAGSLSPQLMPPLALMRLD